MRRIDAEPRLQHLERFRAGRLEWVGLEDYVQLRYIDGLGPARVGSILDLDFGDIMIAGPDNRLIVPRPEYWLQPDQKLVEKSFPAVIRMHLEPGESDGLNQGAHF